MYHTQPFPKDIKQKRKNEKKKKLEKLVYHTNETILSLFLNKCKKMIDEIHTFLKSHLAF